MASAQLIPAAAIDAEKRERVGGCVEGHDLSVSYGVLSCKQDRDGSQLEYQLSVSAGWRVDFLKLPFVCFNGRLLALYSTANFRSLMEILVGYSV